METYIENELRFSKSSYKSWGKRVIQAIDSDDFGELLKVFQRFESLGANINEQATLDGYGGYMWTAWMANFVGDTALHLAIRQKKALCVYAMLLLHADTTIRNDKKETADDLCRQLYKRPLYQLTKEAASCLLPYVSPDEFKYLPDKRNHMTGISYRNVERESWLLMQQSRPMYTEDIPPWNCQVVRGEVSSESTDVHHIDSVVSIIRRQSNIWKNRQLALARLEENRRADKEFEARLEQRKRDFGVPWWKDCEEKLKIMSSQVAANAGDFDPPVSNEQPRQPMAQNVAAKVRRLKTLQNLKFLNGKQRGKDWTREILAKGAATHNTPHAHAVATVSRKSDAGQNTANDVDNSIGNAVLAGESRGSSSHQIQIDLDNGLLPLRFITVISTKTNLRYMNLGDEAIRKLSNVLHGDGIITSICLAHARFSCLGASYLADTIITMDALTYLDLSCNLIADDGAYALAGSLNSCCAYVPPEGTEILRESEEEEVKKQKSNSGNKTNNNSSSDDELHDHATSAPPRPMSLKTLSLAGNRITMAGAKAVLEIAFQWFGNLEFISLANNKLSEEERVELQRYVRLENDKRRVVAAASGVREIDLIAENASKAVDERSSVTNLTTVKDGDSKAGELTVSQITYDSSPEPRLSTNDHDTVVASTEEEVPPPQQTRPELIRVVL